MKSSNSEVIWPADREDFELGMRCFGVAESLLGQGTYQIASGGCEAKDRGDLGLRGR